MQEKNNVIANVEKNKRRFTTPFERQSHVESWKTSGLKMSEYCRQHDLIMSSFSAWAQMPKVKREFKPVSIKQAPMISPAISESIVNKIEIMIEERIKISLFNITDDKLVANILKELIQCN